MKPSRNKLKIPVLIFFIFLIGGFVVYRSGGLDYFFKTSHDNIDNKEADLNVNTPDTLPYSKAISGSPAFSSSKSIVLTDKKMKKVRKLDSIIRVRHQKFIESDSVIPERLIFSGSKSGPVIKPEIFVTDTSKKKQ